MSNMPAHGSVLDIGGGSMSSTILKDLQRVFTVAAKQAKDKHNNAGVGGGGGGGGSEVPTMPDELLYNDEGLAIWAEVIFTPEFYQTRDEMVLFEKNSEEMATVYIPNDATMIDLGAG